MPLINVCCSTFIQTFINLTIFHPVLIFNRFILLASVMLSHAFLNLHLLLNLILILLFNLLGRDIRKLRWLMICTLKAFLAYKHKFI